MPNNEDIWTPVLTTEAELDAVFGPITTPVFSRALLPDWKTIDPFAWPVCKTCGLRRDESLVDRGFECAACAEGWNAKIIALLHPYRRALPDEKPERRLRLA